MWRIFFCFLALLPTDFEEMLKEQRERYQLVKKQWKNLFPHFQNGYLLLHKRFFQKVVAKAWGENFPFKPLKISFWKKKLLLRFSHFQKTAKLEPHKKGVKLVFEKPLSVGGKQYLSLMVPLPPQGVWVRRGQSLLWLSFSPSFCHLWKSYVVCHLALPSSPLSLPSLRRGKNQEDWLYALAENEDLISRFSQATQKERFFIEKEISSVIFVLTPLGISHFLKKVLPFLWKWKNKKSQGEVLVKSLHWKVSQTGNALLFFQVDVRLERWDVPLKLPISSYLSKLLRRKVSFTLELNLSSVKVKGEKLRLQWKVQVKEFEVMPPLGNIALASLSQALEVSLEKLSPLYLSVPRVYFPLEERKKLTLFSLSSAHLSLGRLWLGWKRK